MKKKGVSLGQIKKFLSLLEQKNVTRFDFQKRLDTGIFADVFDPSATSNHNVYRAALELSAFVSRTFRSDIFPLVVDYDLSLEQMIAGWDHEFRDYGINLIRVEGAGISRFEACCFSFPYDISSDEAEKWIALADIVNPWSVAKVEHLISFAKDPLEYGIKFSRVIGLGSRHPEYPDNVPRVILEGRYHRGIDFDFCSSLFGSRNFFLAEREIFKVKDS